MGSRVQGLESHFSNMTSVKELGLVGSSTIKKFDSNLDNVTEQLQLLCPGFYEWFIAKQKTLFQEKVIEEARIESNLYGLYYNNKIESLYFKEKTEKCHKLRSSIDVITALKKITKRQQDDEVCAIYGSGPYKLSNEYNKFSIDNLKWHLMILDEREKNTC